MEIEEIRENIINKVTSALMPNGISINECEIFIDNILQSQSSKIEEVEKENTVLKVRLGVKDEFQRFKQRNIRDSAM